MDNYRRFLEAREASGLRVERFQPGSASQLRLVHDAAKYATFEIRNVIATARCGPERADRRASCSPGWQRWLRRTGTTEKMCSLGIRVQYGRFRYFTGGDLPGAADPGFPAWHAVESALAPIVGRIDVHGGEPARLDGRGKRRFRARASVAGADRVQLGAEPSGSRRVEAQHEQPAAPVAAICVRDRPA
jgi:hypothetical protein